MRVTFNTPTGVIGWVELVGDRVVMNVPPRVLEMLERGVIPKGPPDPRIFPMEGERFLRALPKCFSGSYFWAAFDPED